MGKKLVCEEHKAEITIPDPILMRHFDAYTEATGGSIAMPDCLRGALAILEDGHYEQDGVACPLPEYDEMPLCIGRWIAEAVYLEVMRANELPKNLLEPPSEPPKGKGRSQKN